MTSIRFSRLALFFLLSVLLFVPILSSQAEKGDQAVLSRINRMIKKIEAMGFELKDMLKRQEESVEKIKSLKIWTSKHR